VKPISLSINRPSYDFFRLWAFTQWVTMGNRARAYGYGLKPQFSLPYLWIQGTPQLSNRSGNGNIFHWDLVRCEVFAIGVETESGSTLFSGDGY